MNLKEIVSRYESGESSHGTIEPEILSYAGLYKQPDDSASVEELIQWVDRITALQKEINEILERLSAETAAAKVFYVGRILTPAASLLDHRSEAQVSLQLAERLRTLEDYNRALYFYKRVQELATDDDEQSRALRELGILYEITCHEQLRQWPEMEQTAARLLRDLHGPDPKLAALLHRDLGVASAGQANYDDALKHLHQAVALRQQLDHDGDQRDALAQLYHLIGSTARSAGRYEEALSAFGSARDLLLANHDPWPAAFEMSEIGITWHEIGEHARAREYLEIAATEADKLGRPLDAARWRGDLPTTTEIPEDFAISQVMVWAAALLRKEPPDTVNAISLLRQCIARAQQMGDLRVEAEARNTLAAAHGLTENYNQAVMAGRAAIRLVERLQDKPLEIAFRTNLAMWLTNMRRIDDAEEELRQAITLSREVRASATTTEFRQAINAGLENTYDTLVLLMAQEWHAMDGTVKAKRGDQVIEIAQQARAANFARWLALEAALAAAPADGLRESLLALRAAEVRLEITTLTKSASIAALIEEQMRSRQNFLERAAQSNVAVSFDLPVFGVAELSRTLAPDHCLVDLYAVSGAVIVINVISAGGKLQTALCRWPEQQRLEWLQKWRAKVFKRSGSKSAASGPTIAELLEELKQRFIGDLLATISSCGEFRRITFIPHKELSLIPYWALASEWPDVRISIMPGANVYRLLLERQREINGERVALGDATGSLAGVATELDSLPDFERLPFSLDEVIRRMATANLVHFAGHGRFSDRNPYLSGIVVEPASEMLVRRPFGARTVFGEPLLTVAEVLAKVRLPRCYLVVLSACSTGIPRQHPASEFIGLPAALVIAGSRNVVASLWPVSDGAACLMMQEFYTELLRNAATPSVALARARKALADLHRDAARDRLGQTFKIPEGEFPYRGPKHLLAFQHFGID